MRTRRLETVGLGQGIRMVGLWDRIEAKARIIERMIDYEEVIFSHVNVF